MEGGLGQLWGRGGWTWDWQGRPRWLLPSCPPALCHQLTHGASALGSRGGIVCVLLGSTAVPPGACRAPATPPTCRKLLIPRDRTRMPPLP